MDPWERLARWGLAAGELALTACVTAVALLVAIALRQFLT